MAKYTDPYVLDGATARIAGATALHICAGQPTSRADAITRSLGTIAMDAGDFAFANGDVSGRKVTVAAQTGISVTASGTADHVALIDATRLLHATTMPAQTVTSGNTANTAAWDVEFLNVTP
jgi:hypothetical protein